jgi:hypothetical protein
MEQASMSVRVIRGAEIAERHDGDYVKVSTSSDPNDDTVTLATIQRVTEKLASRRESDSKLHVKTLIMETPMSADVALGFATCYAERKRIPVVYAELGPASAG